AARLRAGPRRLAAHARGRRGERRAPPHRHRQGAASRRAGRPRRRPEGEMTPPGITRRRFLGVGPPAVAAATTDPRPRSRPPRRPARFGVPEPSDVLITRWGTDPYARGSHSFHRVGASAADRRALAAPVAGRLFFAGEATHAEHPSTAHGALLSGRR